MLLHQRLFSNYSKSVRPKSESYTTEVQVAFMPMRLLDVDEKSQSLTFHFSLNIYWTDISLSWSPQEYDNITLTYVTQADIWLPPYTYVNGVEAPEQLGYDQNPVTLFHTGGITWVVSDTASFSCKIDVIYYPFDVQSCLIHLELAKFSTEEILSKTSKKFPIISSNLFDSGGTWEVLYFDCFDLTYSVYTAKFSNHRFRMTMRRRSTYYLLAIILPVLFLSLTASCVFVLPAEAGEKMGVSITVLLSYSVYLSIITDSLPRTSEQVCLLQVYLTSLLGITAAAVLLSVLVLKLHHKPKEAPVGRKTRNILLFIRRIGHLCTGKDAKTRKIQSVEFCPNYEEVHRKVNLITVPDSSQDTPMEKIQDEDKSTKQIEPGFDEVTWPQVAAMLDRVFFILFTAVIVIGTCSIFPYMAYAGSQGASNQTFIPLDNRCLEQDLDMKVIV